MTQEFKFSPMPFYHWKPANEAELQAEFDNLPSYAHIGDMECRECGGNGISGGDTCGECDGDGNVSLTNEELFDRYCREQYADQVHKDMKKYDKFMKDALCQLQKS